MQLDSLRFRSTEFRNINVCFRSEGLLYSILRSDLRLKLYAIDSRLTWRYPWLPCSFLVKKLLAFENAKYMMEFLSWQQVKVIRSAIINMRQHYGFLQHEKSFKRSFSKQFGIPESFLVDRHSQ